MLRMKYHTRVSTYHVDNHFSQSLLLFFTDVLEYIAPVVLQEFEGHR